MAFFRKVEEPKWFAPRIDQNWVRNRIQILAKAEKLTMSINCVTTKREIQP